MTIQISDSLIAQKGLTQQALKEDIAVYLYDKEIFTLAQAARFLEISRLDMQTILAKNKVHLKITPQDVEDDFKTLKKLNFL